MDLIKKIDWQRVEKEAFAVIWLGVLSLIVFAIALLVTIIFCVMPSEGKIFIGSVSGFVIISGLVMRYAFGYGDD